MSHDGTLLMGGRIHRSHAVHHGGVCRKGFLQSSSGLTWLFEALLHPWTGQLHLYTNLWISDPSSPPTSSPCLSPEHTSDTQDLYAVPLVSPPPDCEALKDDPMSQYEVPLVPQPPDSTPILQYSNPTLHPLSIQASEQIFFYKIWFLPGGSFCAS